MNNRRGTSCDCGVKSEAEWREGETNELAGNSMDSMEPLSLIKSKMITYE